MDKIIQTNITNIGDPMIMYENDTYFLYCTYYKGDCFHVFTSKDCINFVDAGTCLSNENSFGDTNFWAPEVIKYDEMYYLFYSARTKSDDLMHIQVAKSKSPIGPFKDVSKKPILNIEGKSTIDASCFIDDDNQKYLFFSMDCSTNVIDGVHTSQIYVIKLNDDFTKVIGDPIFISTPTEEYENKSGPLWKWNEGPFVLKNNGMYYLTYSTNFYASKDYSIGCLISNNILGPYKKENKPLVKYIDGKISGPGHNAFFIDKNGDLKCSFHIHTDINNPSGDRRACICNAYFKKNKLIIDYK